MHKTSTLAIILIITSTFLNTFAQVMYKFGANILEFNFLSIITNLPLILGLITYAISAMIMIIALKKGELSVLYPIFATGYVWVTLVSGYLFNEQLNLYKWIGIFIIIIGVSLIGYGSENKTYTEAVQ